MTKRDVCEKQRAEVHGKMCLMDCAYVQLLRSGRSNSIAIQLMFPTPSAALASFTPRLSLGIDGMLRISRTMAGGDGAARKRWFSSSAQVKTGVVMLNMGGPSVPEETGPFLKRLFQDNDIIDLGGGKFQEWWGAFVARRRTPRIQKQYEEIGGSPIRKWTQYQGEEMAKLLDKTRPESAPHKAYTAFRYAHPLTEEALIEMKKDGVEHAVAFSQFPQWSCTTSGSSMNELWRELRRLNMMNEFKWSLIDRWHLHDGWTDAVLDRMREKLLSDFEEHQRSQVVLVFSAHSVPMKVVQKGDHYVGEVAASVHHTMQRFKQKLADPEFAIPGISTPNKHVIAWQSKVGFLPWMVPETGSVLQSLGKKGHQHVLVVPITFTSDHIETLFEIGMEYAEEAEKAGIKNFSFTQGLNGSSLFVQSLADIVADHLDAKLNHSPQYKMKCLNCIKPLCRQLANPAF